MKITCFGEVLWDVFPDQRKVGGAPLNVALRLKSMGVSSSILTKIGDDEYGKAIKTYIKNSALPVHTIQIDNKYKTGEVHVSLDDVHTATYTIDTPSAWDFIQCSEELVAEVKQSDAIIFGSLASRNAVSRNTLFKLLKEAKFRILDINLRPPHYTSQLLSDIMQKADFIKLNDEELEEVGSLLKIKEDLVEDQIRAIADVTGTFQICVTKGKNGAMLFFDGKFYYNAGYPIKVIDTVGAGDSFLATLISTLLQNETPQKSLDYACAVGAMVAGSEGANPVFTFDEVKKFMLDS
ncbi:carbohydrate kinase [Aquimarina sp. U1-2]|uniref:carbohydrate kinase family protein n=1 Tax=Aquimarina sp. U1-2 TaxID=2823141 RepID=UPI001FED591B|nr:carbohydrate kinase [Aquimarina sp. U1-2]